MQVRDGKHADKDSFDDSKSATFLVTQQNNKPTIMNFDPDKISPQEAGSIINWSVEVMDVEEDTISYQFLLNGKAVTGWQPQNQWTWTTTQEDVGENEVEVRIIDGKHAGQDSFDDKKSAKFVITVPVPAPEPAKVNEPPVLSGLSSSPESPQVLGTAVTWTAQASDAESNPISYRFMVNGSAATEWQPESKWTWTATEPGTSQITVQVKDDQPEGEGGNLSAVFTIAAPAPEPAEEPAPSETENVTQSAPNATGQANVTSESVTPPVTENITTPVISENKTLPINESTPSAPAPVAENQTPVLNSLVPDISSPQSPGVSVVWTANATDADHDRLQYKFFHNGPATGGAWKAETEWTEAGTWTWITTALDAGENQVKAQVRDGKHAAEEGFDSELSAYFTLVAPAKNISGVVYEDRNANSQIDSGEPLSGWTVQLQKPDLSPVSTITKEDGSYRFEQLSPGSYTISITLLSGWKAKNPESGSMSVELGGSDISGENFACILSSFSISGMKYNDLNGNGANDGEPGLKDWKIQLSKDGSVVNTTTTGQDGSYRFSGLSPGSYSVAEEKAAGWSITAPLEGSYSVELQDSDVTGKDFGNHGSWSISGTAFSDLNGNGAKDEGESGLAGWNIQLAQNGNTINATTTGQDGSYAFKNLAPGTYTVSEVAIEGWTQTLPQGAYTVELKGEDVAGKDFGNKGGLTISGVKFYDANENGVQDSSEPSIPGQPVTLMQNGIVIANVTSGEDGSYTFGNLVPGTYEVDDPIVVSVTSSSLVVAPIPISGTSSISGIKFNDLNGNGVKDSGESGIANWEIALTFVGHVGGPVHDTVIAKTKTDSNGAYSFKKLFAGIYKVSEFAQMGWTPTTAAEKTVTLPGSKSDQNFGNKLATQPNKASVWGVKYNDLNGNGINDGEPGLSGWKITLKNLSTNVELTTTTNENGGYSFTNLDPGNYQIREDIKPGWTAVNPATGIHPNFSLAAGNSKELNFANKNSNQPPTILSLAANPSGSQRAGQSVSLKVTATDSEHDSLQYRFIIKGPMPSKQVRSDTGYTGSANWDWSTIGYVPGDYEVEVWVRDGVHGDENSFDAKKSISYKLTSGNLPPTVNVLFADRPAPEYAGSWIKWTALASDPEGDPLQYRFFLRGPSTGGFWIDQTGWSRNNRWIWRTTQLDVGISEVLVAVRDGKHAGPGGSDSYDIADYILVNLNQPPTILGLGSSAPSPQPVGATIRWQAKASDPEDNPVFFRYWLKGPSTGGLWRLARDWSTDPTWSWFTTLADAGTSEVQVQIRDGWHATPAGWDDDAGALFTVQRPNQAPKLTSLKPDKAGPQKAGSLVKWTATASDPDRDPVLYKFWLKGPSTGGKWKAVQEWSTKNQWTWTSAWNDSGAYTVYVYVRDGKHAKATGFDSALGAPYVLLKGNQPPKLTSLKPDKASPQKAGTLVKWTATASDVDKDPILYRFWLKGPSTGGNWKSVQEWSKKNLWTWSNAPSNVGSYSVYVYARDGKHAPPTSYDSAVGGTYVLKKP
ncbi:SdrD B-like domain protein [uncultured archaeon]|nr:SdrD B-like domain protein [uncultured archaeon]